MSDTQARDERSYSVRTERVTTTEYQVLAESQEEAEMLARSAAWREPANGGSNLIWWTKREASVSVEVRDASKMATGVLPVKSEVL